MTVIFQKNFSQRTDGIPLADEYVECNFSQLTPFWNGANWRGHRLFPGDDTPRTFTRCNMVNAEPPPGSILVGCNTWIKEFNRVTGTDDVVINGEIIATETHYADVVLAKLDPDTLTYIDQAEVLIPGKTR
jgi:hypothetical protein